MHRRITFVLVLALALLLAGTEHSTAAPAAQTDLPPAPIVNDEGGPTRLTGSLDYTDFAIRIIMQNPAPALIDMVHVVQGDQTQFAPEDSQILGRMTAPVFPPPLRYAFDLPAEPTATLLDVDNDGETDTGVQIFKLIVSANLNGLSHLEQLDQASDTASFLTDPTTGAITEGSLLVYAPDDQQGFSSGFGDDGLLFTADDPAVALPQGYTVVRFGPDGFTFDRAAAATLDLLANPEAASPDFSDQGILESFNSLIDHLALRYSFTDLRQLDWEAIRAQYLPQVEEAEQLAATNPVAAGGVYGHLLHLLAQQVRDAHVLAVFQDPAYSQQIAIARALKEQPIQNNLGATTVELSDGRIVIADVLEGSPAAEAGWTLGTEIVAVDGVAVADYLPTVAYNENVGTDEGQRLAQVNNLLKFPGASGTEPVAEVTIDAILPGDIAAQSFTLTPGRYALPNRLASLVTRDMPIQYKLAPGFGYLTWGGFTDPEMVMAGLRQFLREVKASPTPLNGVILDLRGNGGGWDLLYFTMASHFFDADQPVSMHWIDLDSFNPNVGELVREAPREYLLSAPEPDLYYGGLLVVLVDQNCASSCEFFTQFLQTNDRATVVAQHASAGAGAPINRVAMPFGITFQYTKGRSYFAGAEELNLEGKGVVPDVRVPVTLESVAAVLAGGDPVLAAGVQEVNDLAGQAFVTSLVLTPTTADVAPDFTAVYPAGWQPTAAGTLVGFIAPDQRSLLSYDTPAAADLAAVLAPLGITDPAAAPVATRTANGVEWAIYASPDSPPFAFRVAVAQIDGKWRVIRIGTSVEIIENAVAGLLYPAIDAYVPGAIAAAPPTAELTQLRATPWQWVAFANPAEQFRVETPLNYLVQFNDDATVNVVADCNNAVGSYQGEGGNLQIELGPMTAAACPPDARSDQFVKLLNAAALYFFQDGNLYIDLFADGGTMVFSPAPPDVFGDDGEGAVAGLPATLVATLGNLSYRGLFEEQEVALVDGAFTETNDAETIAVQLLEPFIALGDLNGDGTQDAVALLELNPGGSGRFTYLAPVLDVLTKPTVGTAVEVGDRIQPNALSITDGLVVAEYIGLGAGDGDCCPSWNIRHTFAWQDGALVEVSRAEVSKLE